MKGEDTTDFSPLRMPGEFLVTLPGFFSPLRMPGEFVTLPGFFSHPVVCISPPLIKGEEYYRSSSRFQLSVGRTH